MHVYESLISMQARLEVRRACSVQLPNLWVRTPGVGLLLGSVGCGSQVVPEQESVTLPSPTTWPTWCSESVMFLRFRVRPTPSVLHIPLSLSYMCLILPLQGLVCLVLGRLST